MGGDSRTQGRAGSEGGLPAGDSKRPHQFTVCLTALQLLFYSDTCFLLFHHCMTWSRAYLVTTDLLMVTGNLRGTFNPAVCIIALQLLLH